MTGTEAAGLLRDRFFGRDDRYLLEGESSALWKREPVTAEVFEAHVAGKKRIGIAADPERTSYLCTDVDGKRGIGRDAALATILEIDGIAASFLPPGESRSTLIEVSRSGQGFHHWVLFAPDDPPTIDEARRFARAVLRLSGLPDDGVEAKGHPGIFPHPPGAKGTGRSPFLPWCGLTNCRRAGLFVNRDGDPYEDQVAHLRNVRLVTRAELTRALEEAEAAAPEPPAPAPRMATPAPGPKPFSGELTRYAEAALNAEIERVLSAGKASRHLSLIAAAIALGELVAGGTLPESLVTDGLRSAAAANGMLDEGREREVERTIADGLAKGAANPRRPDPAPVAANDSILEEPAWIREDEAEENSPSPAPTPTNEAGLSIVGGEADTPESRQDEPIPELPASSWRLGFEEWRRAYGHVSEGSDAFLYSGYKVVAGAALGRMAKLRSGVTVFANIFASNVGESGRARKSTGQGFAREAIGLIDEGIIHLAGVGSAEGLLAQMGGDPDEDALPVGVRLILDLQETASLLLKGQQDGVRSLIPMIVGMYDCPSKIDLPTRKKPLTAIDPFLAIMGSTTLEWLRGAMTVDDVRGGLAGRFEYYTGREKEPIPFPPPPNQEALGQAVAILRAARDRHCALREYGLSHGARVLFEAWYYAERKRQYPSPVLDAVAQRLHLHVWKTALIHAAIEGTPEITAEQMAAALAFGDYQREAQAFTFDGFGESEASKIDVRIIRALTKRGPLAGWEIQQWVRKVDAETLKRRLQALNSIGAIESHSRGRGCVYVARSVQGLKESSRKSSRPVGHKKARSSQ